jgi:protein associated with RNAse G/E
VREGAVFVSTACDSGRVILSVPPAIAGGLILRMNPTLPVGDSITVRVLKYDGAEYRRWQARVSQVRGQLLILDAEFDVEVQHDSLGTIPKGTRTIEYYWLDRWYNIFRFLKDGGGTRLLYCNINTPPSLEDSVLTYVDLDIDILVEPDLSYRILDLEEFERNTKYYGYSDETRRKAQAAVDELKQMIEGRQFPFADELSYSK